MSTMCQVYDSEQTTQGIGSHCAFCHECDSENPSLNGEDQDWCCKSCLEIREASRLNGHIPADLNTQIREYGADDLDTGQKHLNPGLTSYSEEHGNGSLFRTNSIQYSDSRISSTAMTIPISTEEICSSNLLKLETKQNRSVSVELRNGTLGDVRSIRAGDDSDGPENAFDRTPFLTNIEKDPLIWIPPEPEDIEDEMESVANNDDDGDYSDGTKWGQPSSLSSLNEEYAKSHGYKEEHHKAMMETMNGQFKILVSRFLASEGIALYDGVDGESWLNILSSLSWEAALLVKPDANEGRAMDPGSYVKVKCIASGARSQSQVINGLVFKKNTAHKHMPTKFKNPRLLLLQGSLGHSAVSLSSLNSMEEERDYLKSIIEMIETCHPNVVLVEKSVSRDIQESLVAKGITLVFDMKLPRLEKIARCTGSQIISSADILIRPKLKQCDSFHIEKFVEEHNSISEGGKRTTKTLMFLEGCPKPLGCTILLKGAHSDELKKVKRAMHYTIFAAYHLILETSFFADQRAIFTDISVFREQNGPAIDKQMQIVSCGATPNSIMFHPEGSKLDVAETHKFDIPFSDGPSEKSLHGVTQLNSNVDIDGSSMLPSFNPVEENIMYNRQFYDEPDNHEISQSDPSVQPLLPGQLLSSVSTSLKRFLGDSFPPLTSVPISSHFSFNEQVLDGQSSNVPVSLSLEALDHEKELNEKSSLRKLDYGTRNDERAGLASDTENIKQCDDGASKRVQLQSKDDIESALDPQSILVLFSSQCITKQIVCEQSHLSRIKYYGNFDMSLGRLLQDILLNQKHYCSCGEPPESHEYCYTHQNGSLTVLVRQLPRESILPGEADGKIWMWTRCLKCERESGIPKSTKRVVMSSAARGLSFGKFLELSFNSHSATSRLSRCGHSLHRDSLRFFGLGSKVAMFRYSPVEIFAICKPPPVLEFYSPNGQEWLKQEARDVLAKGDLFFTEVANILQTLKFRYPHFLLTETMKISDSVKEFSEIEEMLMQEKTEFEDSLLKAMDLSGQPGKTGLEVLGLNWLKQELLLEICIWDRRLHSILLCTRDSDTSNAATDDKRSLQENDVILCNVEENMTESGTSLETPIQIPIDPEESSSSVIHQGRKTIVETELEIESAEISGNTGNGNNDSFDIAISDVECSTSEKHTTSITEKHLAPLLDQDNYSRPSDLSPLLSNMDCEEESIPILDHMQVDNTIPAAMGAQESAERGVSLEVKTDHTVYGGGISAQEHLPDVYISQESCNSRLEDPDEWIWAPFSELRSAFRKDYSGFVQKFGFINSYTPTHLPPICQVIAQEVGRLHFPVQPAGKAISVYEDDISSIIACALALSEANKVIDNSCSLTFNGFMVSSSWASNEFSESEGMPSSQSASTFSSDDLTVSGSDASLLVDRLIDSEDLHPEVPLEFAKAPGKSKYSVVCIHAKQFYALRRRCCPSEMAYISSLSRCRKWDAQGGKSKAFFAKSMDDRFIIKQIKKTELDSFLKFAPDYFKHISLSLDSGSQTCLAKILGIYQVRQNKNGKEVKTDVMVMENLLFGRNISRKYDLKGAIFSRHVSDTNDPECVLLDQNFIEDMRISPIYIRGKAKHLLQRAIWNDTSFLTSMNVMDYSLLVGVDKQRNELVFGIIDYLRQYTWDKQLETWVKASLVVPKNSLPTVISPKEYKKRFRKFMTKYFLTVPDSWSSERCSGPCKFCANSSGSSKFLVQCCQSSQFQHLHEIHESEAQDHNFHEASLMLNP